MKYINPGSVNGTVVAPGSKSDTVRALAAAALAPGKSEIINPNFGRDCRAALGVIQQMGVETFSGQTKLITYGRLHKGTDRLDCNESGLCFRLFSFIAALEKDEMVVTGRGSLLQRPAGMVEGALRQLDIYCSSSGGYPPLRIKGPLRGGYVEVDGSITSQHISGLLMALPLAESDSEIRVSNLKSKPYLQMTMAVLEHFGLQIEVDSTYEYFNIRGGQQYKPRIFQLEGDWSGAAFFLVAGAIAGSVTVEQLSVDSLQADRAVLDVLQECGADVQVQADSVSVNRAPLFGFEFDATACPDLFPPLVVLACNCKGTSYIRGLHRLQYKETNRAWSLQKEFNKLGAVIHIDTERDQMVITGRPMAGGIFDSHHDHRLAMAGAIAGLASRQKVGVLHADCVDKSYPEFYDDLKLLGAHV